MLALPWPDPPLQDDRLVLRPWADTDVTAILRATRDPEIPRFTRVPPQNTEQDVLAFLLTHEPLRRRGASLELLRVRRDGGALVGPMSLHHVDLGERSAQVGYWTALEARGEGLTLAGLRLLSAWALDPAGLGLERLELRADADNRGSRAVAERAGFRLEGVLRGVERRKGRRFDQAVHGLLATDLAG